MSRNSLVCFSLASALHLTSIAATICSHAHGAMAVMPNACLACFACYGSDHTDCCRQPGLGSRSCYLCAETNIIIEGDDKAAVEAVEAADRDAENVRNVAFRPGLCRFRLFLTV